MNSIEAPACASIGPTLATEPLKIVRVMKFHMQSTETLVRLTRWMVRIIKRLISFHVPGQFWILIGWYFMLANLLAIRVVINDALAGREDIFLTSIINGGE